MDFKIEINILYDEIKELTSELETLVTDNYEDLDKFRVFDINKIIYSKTSKIERLLLNYEKELQNG